MRRSRLFASLAVVSALGFAACAAPEPDVTATRSDEAVSIRPEDPDGPTGPMNDCGEFPSGEFPYDAEKPPQCYDQFLVASLTDIESYWATIYPQVYDGEPYVALEGGIFPGYPERTTRIPGCGSSETAYEDVAGNAFYCGLGDFVAYDDAQLLPFLDQKIGRAVIAVVLAHEWGHVIQGRQDALGRRYPTYNTEQQADCFAGAWAAHVARGEADGLTFSNADVIAGLNGMILVADPIEGQASDPGAHGSAFDRVRAFQDGYVNGALICKPYLDNPTDSTLMPFVDMQDAANSGNLPADDLLVEVQGALDVFWGDLLQENGIAFTAPTLVSYPHDGPFPACDDMADALYPNNFFYCAATNELMFDAGFATGLYDGIGDFAIGYLIGNAYSDAVQSALGSTFAGAQRSLFNDCLTGVWTRALFPGSDHDERYGSISPGDLDEAVRAALAVGDPDADTDRNGTAFDKIVAFRTGVLSGLDECNSTYGS